MYGRGGIIVSNSRGRDMNLSFVDSMVRWLGGLLAYTTLGIILFWVWRGSKRQAGRTTGLNGSWLRSFWFYLASAAFFFGVCYFGWIPLSQMFSPQARAGSK
jgi:hypothetical protein